jgi:hypothetical protein
LNSIRACFSFEVKVDVAVADRVPAPSRCRLMAAISIISISTPGMGAMLGPSIPEESASSISCLARRPASSSSMVASIQGSMEAVSPRRRRKS